MGTEEKLHPHVERQHAAGSTRSLHRYGRITETRLISANERMIARVKKAALAEAKKRRDNGNG